MTKPCCAACPESRFPRESWHSKRPVCSQIPVSLHFQPTYTLLQCQFIPLESSPLEQRDGVMLILLIRLMVETGTMQTQGSKENQGKYSVYSFERGRGEGVAGKPEHPHSGDEP